MSLYNTISQALATERVALQYFQTSLDEVELRLARQRAEVASSETHIEFLKTRLMTVGNTCDDMLWQLRREFFNIVSSEVLLHIFEEVIPNRMDWRMSDFYFDKNVARAPFRLAAVCKRWRRLAISTSTLWTYLTLPALRNLTQAHVKRVSCLVSRSEPAPVDVIARWQWSESTETTAPHANAISRLISSLAHRLRLIYWSTDKESDDVALDGLRGPTPHLTQLRIRSASQSLPSVFKDILPSAPRLKGLVYNSNHLGWSFAAQQYTTLTLLTVWYSHDVANLPPIVGDGLKMLNLLRIVSNSLEVLNVGNSANGVTVGEGMFLELPRLATLRIRDWDWTRYLRAPALQKLAISNVASQRTTPPSDALQPFARVTHLELFVTLLI